jgi:hypothetical protein
VIWQPPVRKKILFWSRSAAAGAFFCEKYDFGGGTLPQALFFFMKKCVFGPGTLPQAPFFGGK